MLDRINTLVLSAMTRASRQEGQTMTEYAMVLALIALVAFGAVAGLEQAARAAAALGKILFIAESSRSNRQAYQRQGCLELPPEEQ